MANSHAKNNLKKEGMEVMVSGLLYDLTFKCRGGESLEVSLHFKNFLIQLDRMLDDDMILEIKEVVCDVLP